MNVKPLPATYLFRVAKLTWGEALWGAKTGWMEPGSLVELAVQRLVAGSSEPKEIELAGLVLGREHDALHIASELAELEPAGEVDPTAKWLCLGLRWVFDNRGLISDPLGVVEDIYAAFDYPPEVAAFVRYMPADESYDPTRYSREENEAQLYENWLRFLRNCNCWSDSGP